MHKYINIRRRRRRSSMALMAAGRIYGAEGCAWCRCRARPTSPTTTAPPTSGPWPRRRLLRRRRSPASSGDRTIRIGSIHSSSQASIVVVVSQQLHAHAYLRLGFSPRHADRSISIKLIKVACMHAVNIYIPCTTITLFLLLLACKGRRCIGSLAIACFR